VTKSPTFNSDDDAEKLEKLTVTIEVEVQRQDAVDAPVKRNSDAQGKTERKLA